MAKKLGVSLGGVNYALQALGKRRFVNAKNFQKVGHKACSGVFTDDAARRKKTFLATALSSRKVEGMSC